jgi:hypothetical protein
VIHGNDARHRHIHHNETHCPFAANYNSVMFFAAHFLLFSRDAEADRAFLRDVLEMPAADAGDGWLIFRLPSAEMAVHPGAALHDGEEIVAATFYLMCRDLKETMAKLERKGAICGDVHEARWGSVTSIPLPGGSKIGLYEPRHPLAIEAED